jgi:hypothetical protein
VRSRSNIAPVGVEQTVARARGARAEEAEGGAEATGGWGQFHQPSRAICRRISSARRSTGFTSGHASCPHVVDVMERIESRTRTHGRRNGSGFTRSLDPPAPAATAGSSGLGPWRS